MLFDNRDSESENLTGSTFTAVGGRMGYQPAMFAAAPAAVNLRTAFEESCAHLRFNPRPANTNAFTN